MYRVQSFNMDLCIRSAYHFFFSSLELDSKAVEMSVVANKLFSFRGISIKIILVHRNYKSWNQNTSLISALCSLYKLEKVRYEISQSLAEFQSRVKSIWICPA